MVLNSEFETTLPFEGSLIFIFSSGFKTTFVHSIVLFPSLISKISPGNPPYIAGPVETGISGVNQAVITTVLVLGSAGLFSSLLF